jgi:hypothetical protein
MADEVEAPTEDDLFRIYPCKNPEIRMLGNKAFEFGRQCSYEPSAGSSIGVDQFAIDRNRRYCDVMDQLYDAIHNRPLPDLPATWPARYDVDLSVPYQTVTRDNIPINEDTELLSSYWLANAVHCVKSQSAAQAGSMMDADYARCKQQISVIRKFLDEVEKRPIPDLPSTAEPGAPLGIPIEPRAKGTK